jgi:hypothetical protein
MLAVVAADLAADNEPGALDVGKYARCWVIAPMPGSLRIRWHKQGGEANDARSGPPLIGC